VTNLTHNFIKALKLPRWRWSLFIAIVSDAIGFAVIWFLPAQWLVDAITAIALLLIIGFRWQLFVSLAIEVIPALELFPAWTLVVLTLLATPQHSIDKEQDK
jgi:hypothetical protein